MNRVSRRLDTDERRAISSGCVFVWEERGPNAEATGVRILYFSHGLCLTKICQLAGN